MEEKLHSFCFDVLQDFINPNDYIIEQDRRGDFRVIILRTRGIPKEIIRDEWKHKANGTEFEKVSLFM